MGVAPHGRSLNSSQQNASWTAGSASITWSSYRSARRLVPCTTTVRDVLGQWAPEPGSPLRTLWTQVQQATELYETEIDTIRDEGYRGIGGTRETP